MKHTTFFLALVLLLIQLSVAKMIIVDKSGSGQYTTIQGGINASSAGDTVRVLPGIYNEALIVNKAVVIQGSGYETTIITSSNNPTITMSAGKLMWFAVTSSGGNGANISAGSITNCVISGCTGAGVYFHNSTGSVKNCVLIGNAVNGALGDNDFYPYQSGSATNCIARNNRGGGAQFYGLQGLTYSCGSSSSIGSSANVIDQDPLFASSSDFRISPTSPCWDAGNPADQDPDGSRSDMGYYGGFDAPVFPVVTGLRLQLNTDGTVTVKATAQSRY